MPNRNNTVKGVRWVPALKRLLILLIPLFIFLCLGVATGILTNPQSGFESLEITGVEITPIGGGWNITMQVKNIGTAEAMISYIDVNGTVIDKSAGLTNADGLTIPVHGEVEFWVKISDSPYGHGSTAKFTIHTVAMNNYIQFVILPRV